jgi:polyhydroxybutyrate depolymerase
MDGQAQSTIADNLVVDGTNRTYQLYVPPGADTGPKRPLIINMHGYANDAPYQANLSAMNPIADTAGFYVVYPNARPGLFFQRQWRDDLADAANPDILFLGQLIDALGASYNIDTSKVFATGYSNGGGMAVALACALPGRIKGIAPIAAAIPQGNASRCTPALYRPLLQIHGTADGVININGGSLGPDLRPTVAALDFFKFWTRRDGCGGPVLSAVPDVVPSDGTTADAADILSCSSGNRHRFYRIQGGDHDIPGPTGNNEDVYSSAVIWDFFRAQGGAFGSLREAGPGSASASGTSVHAFASGGSIHSFASGEGALQLQPNPAQSFTRFDTGTDGDWQARVMDASGRVVLATQGSGAEGQLDLSALPNGLYLLQLGERQQRLQVMR